MKHIGLTITWLLIVVVIAGCGSAQVDGRRSYVADEEIPRPGRIIIYDFAATADDLSPSSAITGRYKKPSTPQTEEEIRLGRELGSRVADELVKDLIAMGLPAERHGTGPAPNIGDLVITGEFVTIDEGDRLKRMIIGFGFGAAELTMAVEGYQITEGGPRLLGSADVQAQGGRGPGMAVPMIVGGGILGNPRTSAVVGGGVNVAQELGPERIQAVADRAAGAVSKEFEAIAKRRGWI